MRPLFDGWSVFIDGALMRIETWGVYKGGRASAFGSLSLFFTYIHVMLTISTVIT